MPTTPGAVQAPQGFLSGLAQRARGVYYGWYLVGGGVVLGFLGALNNYGFSVFFLPITKELSLSRAQTSLVFSAARLEGGLEAPFAGWLTDKLGPRIMLLVGNTLAGVGFILLGTVVDSFWTLFIVWVFVTSLGFQTGFFTGLTAAINSWFFRRRAFTISIINSSNRLGGFIWTPLLAFIVQAAGWRPGAVIAGVVILVLGTPIALMFRRSPESMGLRPDGDPPTETVRETGAAVSEVDVVSNQIDFTVKEAMKTSTFWIFATAQFCRMLSFSAIAVHLIPMLVWKGQSQLAAASIASIYPAIGVVLALVFGRLGDLYSPKHIIGFATMVSAASLIVLALGNGLLLLYLAVILYGIGESANALNIAMLGNYFGRKNFATLRGILASVTVIGPFIAPVYAGWVFDRTESYLWALVPFFVSKALAGPLYMLIPKPKPPRRSAA